MAKINVTRELVLSIVNQENSKFVKDTTKKINQILTLALKKLSSKVSYVTLDNIILQPINELMNGSVVDNSAFVYFLGVNNAQLELNTIKKIKLWEVFKEQLKNVWINRKLYRKKKKKRNKELDEKAKNNFNFDPSKYSIYNLTADLQDSLIEFLSESSIVYLKENMLQIVGKDDFGTNTSITIYVVNCNEEIYKFYAGKKKGFIEFNIKQRYNILEEKINKVGDNFINVLKVFNTLYYNVNGTMPNQVLLESILCFCPENLFYGNDIYAVFLKLINYISIKTIRNVKSNNNINKTVFQDETCNNSAIGFNKMLAYISNNQ